MKQFLRQGITLLGIGLVMVFSLWQPTSPVAAVTSRAKAVNQLNQLVKEVKQAEQHFGEAGPAGIRIYNQQETAVLLEKYQLIRTKLDYLKGGQTVNAAADWAGYTLNGAAPNFTTAQVKKALAEFVPGLPSQFFSNLHIFLLPEAIPDVGGLGGPGYTLLSGETDRQYLTDEALRITLYHEIGHHVHLSYMPTTPVIPALSEQWNTYLKLRGGSWHDSGAVNTEGWSNSSEETFAEDFRMLFGKDQPFLGDIRLGDPRNEPQQAQAEKQFIQQLATKKPAVGYRSPWLPEEIAFWQMQPLLIAGLWLVLGSGLAVVRLPRFTQPRFRFSARDCTL